MISVELALERLSARVFMSFAVFMRSSNGCEGAWEVRA